MKELNPESAALLQQYRADSEVCDQPDASVYERIEASIAQGAAPPAEPPRRAAAWVAMGAFAAAAVAVGWMWSAPAELRVLGSSPVVSAVDRIVESVEQRPRVNHGVVPDTPSVAPPDPAPVPLDPPVEPRAQPRGKGLVAPPTGAPSLDDSLRQELELLRRARKALREGRSGAAQAALRSHAGAYPRGQLAEEREALLVVVRCDDGKAQTGRAAFEASYPRSHHLAAIRAACDPDKKSPPVTDERGSGK